MGEDLEENERQMYLVKRLDKAPVPNEVEVTFDLARLQLFQGSGEIKLNFSGGVKPSFLFFTYMDDELVIEELYSYQRRVGHGRILLESLLDIIQIYDIKVESYNKHTSQVKFKQITKITGTVREGGGITHDDLKTFYRKCGFLKNNKLLKELI
ncbi:hypothetical protein [Paenibacillus illinoisensis]|uniref:N-acetyltransferase domain-containing protein n=1 Tax=Paenibacillus illinoisensis TaxID=59845 RepID=A0A2W0C9R5_9BACL|nr:hypothetical protein [Paenibacillus illinoisensis]PYY29753.1 Uncharacterized protein PIL02S_01953 [Paenibacillus illinoisensis]